MTIPSYCDQHCDKYQQIVSFFIEKLEYKFIFLQFQYGFVLSKYVITFPIVFHERNLSRMFAKNPENVLYYSELL